MRTQSLDVWEEIPMALIFRRAREHATRNGEHSWTHTGLSAALFAGIYNSLPHESDKDIARITELHHTMCKTQEIRQAMQGFAERAWKPTFREFDIYGWELLEIYFQFMELWATDVGLTYRFDPDTLYGDLWYNSSKGPEFWK